MISLGPFRLTDVCCSCSTLACTQIPIGRAASRHWSSAHPSACTRLLEPGTIWQSPGQLSTAPSRSTGMAFCTLRYVVAPGSAATSPQSPPYSVPASSLLALGMACLKYDGQSVLSRQQSTAHSCADTGQVLTAHSQRPGMPGTASGTCLQQAQATAKKLGSCQEHGLGQQAEAPTHSAVEQCGTSSC